MFIMIIMCVGAIVEIEIDEMKDLIYEWVWYCDNYIFYWSIIFYYHYYIISIPLIFYKYLVLFFDFVWYLMIHFNKNKSQLHKTNIWNNLLLDSKNVDNKYLKAAYNA